MSSKLFYGALATARQVSLLKAERIARMLDCETAQEAFRLAQEGGFGGQCATVEEAVTFERNALADFFRNECPSEMLKKYLLSKFDFINCEIFVKAKYLGFDERGMTLNCGLIPADYLKECVNKDEYQDLPVEMAQALAEADKAFVEKTADGFGINNLFIKAYYRYILRLTKWTFVQQDVVNRIDCVNLMSAVRCDGDAQLFEDTFVEGGSISKQRVALLLTKDFGAVEKEFMFDEAGEFVRLLARDVAEGRPTIAGEAFADSMAIRRMTDKRFDLTPDQEFYLYWLYKQSQITNVNVIVVGKSNNADKAEIKMRLRESYEN